jgi:hypothetical protein
VQAGSERLDAVVNEEVLLLKADVEGWEAQVGLGLLGVSSGCGDVVMIL